MDGKELATRLKAQAETANAKLIALTGYSEEQESINALEAGFDHYLVKPVDTNKLLGLLNSF
jgi:DNA-binding response OmpR family regulator